jgi:ResB-like family
MTELDKITDTDAEQEAEHYPVEPRYHPIHKIPRNIYDFLASAKLAMFLLVAILLCCLTGTTIYRGKQAWEVIFSTLWFNGLLVLLIVNVACCFFGRIWGRRVTLISLGMILFHLSFVCMFAGVIYNSLFYFRGTIRLTEGETLSNNDPQSYDLIEQGRYFNLSKLKGETKLIRMHTGYKADGKDKRAAYEIAVGYGPLKKQEIIYITKHLAYRGFKYFPDKEGYSVLSILYDSNGKELFGGHLPLQSLKLKDGAFLYTTGTKDGPAAIPFPQQPAESLFGMNVTYKPAPNKERSGEAFFELYPLVRHDAGTEEKPIASGKAAIGARFDAGDYSLSVKEVRYWVAMSVRYDPGQPIVLTSLWVGLFGVTLTTAARMFRKKRQPNPTI